MLEPLGFVKNLVETVKGIAAAGFGAVVATTFNGLAIASGTDTSGNPNSIAYIRLGSFYVGSGSGAIVSWSAPGRGSIYIDTVTGFLYWKYGTNATDWARPPVSGGAFAASTIVASSTIQTSAFLQIAEQSAPAGATDQARFYVDNGGAGGKSRALIIFQSGAAQVIASEP